MDVGVLDQECFVEGAEEEEEGEEEGVQEGGEWVNEGIVA